MEIQKLGDQLTGNVIARWTETACQENNFRAWKNLRKSFLQRGTIWNGALFINPKTKLENFVGDKPQMRVQHLAKQKLGTAIDDDDAHGKK